MSHSREPDPRHDDATGRTDHPSPALSRRNLLQFGAVGLGALTLAACGGPSVSSGKSGNGGGSTASTAPTTGSTATASPGSGGAATGGTDYSGVKPAPAIEFWSVHPGSSAPIETELVKAYNASQSETKVKLVTAGANYADVAQKFQTALASNQVPALVTLSDVWWFTYALNGQTIPLEPVAKAAGVDTSDYVETFYNDYSYNGSHWALPYARSTPLFYYNKRHFQTAGLPDRAPKTWDEMDEFAKKLQAAKLGTKAVYNWALPTNYIAWYYQNKDWGWGGEYSNKWDLSPIVGSGMLSSLQWAAKTMQKNGGWAGMTSNSQSNDLAAGVVSTCLDSTGTIGSLTKNAKFPLGAGFLPGGPKATDHVCPTGGTGISISAKSGPAQQLAAMKFLSFLTNAANTIKFCLFTGYLPVRKSANTSDLTSKSPLTKVSLAQLDHLRSQDWARVFITGGDLAIGNGIGEVLLKNADPETAMQNVQKQLQQAYDQNIKPHLK